MLCLQLCGTALHTDNRASGIKLWIPECTSPTPFQFLGAARGGIALCEYMTTCFYKNPVLKEIRFFCTRLLHWKEHFLRSTKWSKASLKKPWIQRKYSVICVCIPVKEYDLILNYVEVILENMFDNMDNELLYVNYLRNIQKLIRNF